MPELFRKDGLVAKAAREIVDTFSFPPNGGAKAA